MLRELLGRTFIHDDGETVEEHVLLPYQVRLRLHNATFCLVLYLSSPQIAQLCNLCPPDVEAARMLVPGMDSFTDEDIADVLAIIDKSAARMMLA